MKSYSISTCLLLAAVGLPAVALAATCGADAKQEHVHVASSAPVKDGVILPAGEYCFSVVFDEPELAEGSSVQWVLERHDEDKLVIDVSKGGGDAKAKAAIDAEVEIRDREKREIQAQLDSLDTLDEAAFANAMRAAGRADVPSKGVLRQQLVRDERDIQTDIENLKSKKEALTNVRRDHPGANEILPETYPFNLEASDKLTVKIWLKDHATSEDPTQQYTYEIQSDGHWDMSYGLLFLPGHDKEYYTRNDGNNGYVITRKNSDNGLSFAPALIWSWNPAPTRMSFCRKGGFKCSFAAGIAADSSSPILFAGLQGTYHQNISLNFGVAIHQQKRLSGEYAENQTLTEAVQTDTLAKSVYRPNLYFGVSFRFDKSPF